MKLVFFKNEVKIPELDGNCINGTLFDPFMQLPSNSVKSEASLLRYLESRTGKMESLVTRLPTVLFNLLERVGPEP